jgi:hypothetical protein
MTVHLSIPVPVIGQGDKAPVWFRTNGRIPFGGGRLALQVTTTLPMGGKQEKTWFLFHLRREKKNADTALMKTEYHAGCVGNIQMEITKVWCYDLLGLIAIPLPPRYWKTLEKESLLVLPKMCEVPVMVSRRSRDFAGESEEYSKEKGGDDSSQIFQIREYQPGDKLRSIHWKVSAKTDELMVKEQSLPLGCPVDLYLNFCSSPKRKKRQSQKTDSYLQVAASISHSLVREGCRHHIIWFDKKQNDILRYRIEKEEDIYEALLLMGHLESDTVSRDLSGLYRQKYHDTPGITRLELSMNLTLRQNGVVVTKYTGSWKELEKQLGERELIV